MSFSGCLENIKQFRKREIKVKKRLTQEEIEELVIQVKTGDDDAFTRLLNHYEAYIKGIINRNFFVGVWKEYDDLLQVARIGFYESIHSFKPELGHAFHGFFPICIKRKIRNEFKMSNNNKHRVLNESFSVSAPVEGEEVDGYEFMTEGSYTHINDIDYMNPLINLELREIEEDFNITLNKRVNSITAKVYKMRYDGYSIDDISSELGINKKKVDNLLQNGKRRLNVFREEIML
jgi:RNA polymerase sigma factor (sigma-70 family)